MMQFRKFAANPTWLRLVMVLIVVAGLTIPAALVGPLAEPSSSSALAQDDDDGDDDGGDDDDDGGNGQGGTGDDEDDNRGHGNDDGVDEDNPGRGRGPNRDDEQGQQPVAPVATFVIEIACPYDPAVDRTTCTFAGRGETAGLREIGVPAGAVCAEIVGGDYERGDFPGGPTEIADEGYSSRSGRVELVLILDGEVPHGGPVTYWVATDRGTFPAEGPSLGCTAEAVPLGAAPTATVAAGAENAGVVEVSALACGDGRPVDAAAFDWYGRCQEPRSGAIFALVLLDADARSVVGEVEVDLEGTARFEGLAPGTYELDETNGSWCHAESDHVNERGELVIEAGDRVTVWIFHCEPAEVK